MQFNKYTYILHICIHTYIAIPQVTVFLMKFVARLTVVCPAQCIENDTPKTRRENFVLEGAPICLVACIIAVVFLSSNVVVQKIKNRSTHLVCSGSRSLSNAVFLGKY